MFRTASSVFHLLPIAGLYTFLPKYLESQFHLPAHDANLISAFGGILVMGIGIVISGVVLLKFSPTARSVAAWIAFTALAYSIGLYLLRKFWQKWNWRIYFMSRYGDFDVRWLFAGQFCWHEWDQNVDTQQRYVSKCCWFVLWLLISISNTSFPLEICQRWIFRAVQCANVTKINFHRFAALTVSPISHRARLDAEVLTPKMGKHISLIVNAFHKVSAIKRFAPSRTVDWTNIHMYQFL